MTWPAAERLLVAGLAKLGQPVSLRDPLLAFLHLLEKWNAAYNLTAVREPERMVTHHVLDSLAVIPYLRGPRIVDVGAGAGIPGIPLALACPEFKFVLLDSNAKKTRFITQAINELGLTNVSVERTRAEGFHPAQSFDTVISRAFASLAEMLDMTQHLGAPDGVFVAMKGNYPQNELDAMPPQFRVDRVELVQVPGLDAQRHVVCLTKVGGTHPTT
ncbi:MAG: 16S rRNA (guanine(527)-N(7))-methyltransferase RsmG [Gammaproteobacteria bacterium]|nr:16S rRNA (guanine(527)-N(7))-methyltransferase RsmG [Gammaproteobacteria bacterium]